MSGSRGRADRTTGSRPADRTGSRPTDRTTGSRPADRTTGPRPADRTTGSLYRRAPSDRADRGAGRGDRGRPPPRERAPRPARPVAGVRVARRRRRLLVASVVVVLLAAVLALTFSTPWLDVTRVDVVGAAPENRAQVEEAAAIAPGTSLLWLDGDLSGSGVAERVSAVPRIAAVDVQRRWPHTLVVTVSEREPVLAVPVVGGSALVDETGLAFRTVPVTPPGLAVLRLAPGVAPSPTEPATAAAVRVVTSLPADLRREVREIRATGAFDVALTLTEGREVRWGGAEDDARKAEVLRALLARPGSSYDVSSPDLPTVR